ncbi:hypothetical protein [Sporomusa malonica]|nr:hypothetical protein [Sporomusa malonica]
MNMHQQYKIPSTPSTCLATTTEAGVWVAAFLVLNTSQSALAKILYGN